MRKPTPAWPMFVLEWHCRWPIYKILKRLPRLLISYIPTTSHNYLVSLSSYSFLSRVWRCTSL